MGRPPKVRRAPDGEVIVNTSATPRKFSHDDKTPKERSASAAATPPTQAAPPGVPLTPEKVAEVKAEAQAERAAETDKKKRGRKPKATPADPNAEVDPQVKKFVEGMKSFSGIILDMLVRRMPNPIPASDLEKDLWNDATNKMLEKYVPMLGAYAVEAEFFIVVGILAMPRMKKDSPFPRDGKAVEVVAQDT